ncbi:DNA polymerase IV [Priestia koreensis]|uniref:DNA polymerase IV n=1 Tax=Priestia koreensis TaxID=284581 RepID=A0A0M0L5I3_9BACI|nr:DNA polymerase IV [Priestia koreensis]KOO46299.1 DNA polymerase IV [Priestia koreensis]
MKSMYPKNGRVILHVDANAFYASVETAHDPSLEGKALAIAVDPKERRGIIVTCNYQARSRGVYTTMTVWEAKRKCPELIVRKPNFPLYREVSAQMFEFLSTISPLIEPASIDEGYVDITDCYEMGAPLDMATYIQRELLEQYKIPVSIGIAPNKFLAKTASDMKKPLGITVLRKRDIPSLLWARPVSDMHGIGEKTAEKLSGIHIYTIEDLAKADDAALKSTLGVNGIRLKNRANGIDDRQVDPESINQFKSIGNSTTLPADVTDEHAALEIIQRLSETVSARMKRKEVVSSTIQIMLKYSDRKLITRSRSLHNPIVESSAIFQSAAQLFTKNWNGDPLRLIGVTAMNVEVRNDALKQLDLFSFEEEAKQEPLIQTMEKLNEKYGDNFIRRGFDRNTSRSKGIRDDIENRFNKGK